MGTPAVSVRPRGPTVWPLAGRRLPYFALPQEYLVTGVQGAAEGNLQETRGDRTPDVRALALRHRLLLVRVSESTRELRCADFGGFRWLKRVGGPRRALLLLLLPGCWSEVRPCRAEYLSQCAFYRFCTVEVT